MPELNPQAEGWLAELKDTFEARRDDYAWTEVVGGYSTVTPNPVIVHMVVRFHPREDTPRPSRTNYRHFTLFSVAAEVTDGWAVFESLARDHEVSLGTGFPPLRFPNSRVDQPYRHDSKSYPSDEDWPVDVGLLTANPDGRLQHELLASSRGPLYSGPQEAINEVTHVPVGWRGYAPSVYLIMPDRRARIVAPHFSSTCITGSVERGPVPTEGLVLKGYASPVDSATRNRERISAFEPPARFELDEPSGPFTFDTGFFPNHFILVLIEKGSDSTLDRREYESSRMALANDLSFQANSTYLEDLIRGGESERVEFKESFEGNDSWLRSVTAFSNGAGGTLLFGVADDGSVVGLSSPKSSEWVAQKIRAAIEPFPSYRYEVAEVHAKTIAYIDVESGLEKPYSVRDLGIFVRAQATTRQASRHEFLLLAREAFGETRRQT